MSLKYLIWYTSLSLLWHIFVPITSGHVQTSSLYLFSTLSSLTAVITSSSVYPDNNNKINWQFTAPQLKSLSYHVSVHQIFHRFPQHQKKMIKCGERLPLINLQGFHQLENLMAIKMKTKHPKNNKMTQCLHKFVISPFWVLSISVIAWLTSFAMLVASPHT